MLTEIQLETFRAAVQQMITDRMKISFPTLSPPAITLEPGKKYCRVVKTDCDSNGVPYSAGNGQRSVFCFVDMSNGDILKSASWKVPAKHPRGNIFDGNNGMSGLTEYGAVYLK